MNFGVDKKSYDEAKNEFLMVFGPNHIWFIELFNLIREVELKEKVKFTDVLIKQGKPVFLGILKNFFNIKHVLGEGAFDNTTQKFTRGLTEIEIKDFVEGYFSFRENYKLTEADRPKQLNFSLNIYGLGCFRVNFSTNDDGVTLNIRILDFNIPELKTLLNPKNPFDARYINFFDQLIETKDLRLASSGKTVKFSKIKKGGLILHAGPTGSGKSTFIASELHSITNSINGLVITYEDPIEYRFTEYPKVLQVELGASGHLLQQDIVKHFLRNSPAVGAFHEIKTREEFEDIIDLASRGHLIFTTVHANNVKDVFSSFAILDEQFRQLFSTTLLAVVCHKLDVDSNNKIYPLLEVFLNDAVMISDPNRSQSRSVFNLFIEKSIIKLGNLLYNERAYPYFFSFDEYSKIVK